MQIPPLVADLLKSATGQFDKLPTYALQIPPPQVADFLKSATHCRFAEICMQILPPRLQIFWNLPLDSLLSYLHVLADSPPQLQIFWNLPLDSLLSYLHVLCRFLPWVADFLRSATHCRFAEICIQIPPLQIFWNLPLDSLLSYLHVLFRFPPLQKSWNLPLDSLLSYLHVLCRFPPPPIADFLKSATGQFAKLSTCALQIPPICRFHEICHWTVC